MKNNDYFNNLKNFKSSTQKNSDQNFSIDLSNK